MPAHHKRWLWLCGLAVGIIMYCLVVIVVSVPSVGAEDGDDEEEENTCTKIWLEENYVDYLIISTGTRSASTMEPPPLRSLQAQLTDWIWVPCQRFEKYKIVV